MRRSALATLLLAAALPTAGCAVRVAVSSTPVGAYVTLGDTRAGVTPLDLAVPLVGPRALRVEMTGYRPLDVRLGLFPPPTLELRLVREHGPTGTWDPEDVR